MRGLEIVAVAGATGNAGKEIVRALSARGLRVRALVRAPERLGEVRELCEQIRVVDVTEAASLAGALDGADGLISAVGKTRQRDKTPREKVDVEANRNLFAEATRANVNKIGFISVAGAVHDHPAVMMRMKADAEDALKSAGKPYVIVQPGGYFSDLWEAFQMCRRGTFYCLGDGQVRFNPISLSDLGEFAVSRFLSVTNRCVTLPVGGPQVLTMPELAEICGKILRRKVRVIHIPMWAGKAIVPLFRPFSRNWWELAQFFVESIDYFSKHADQQVLPSYGSDRVAEYLSGRYAKEA